MSPKPPDESNLVASINESAKHISALTLTFLAVCVYVGVAVGSTTHRMLLVGKDFTLPLFSTEVPLERFYQITPLLVIILHVHLLMQNYVLVKKLASPPWNGDGLAIFYFPEITLARMLGWKLNIVVRGLLKLIRWTIYLFLPVGILLLIQVQFLPYHDSSTTLWHQRLVTADLALILIFRGLLAHARRAMGVPKRAWAVVLYPLSWVVLIGLVVAAFCFTWSVAEIPDPNQPGRPGSSCQAPWPRKNLCLREQVLLAHEPSPDQLAVYAREKRLTLEEAELEHIKGVSLKRRNLTGADFSGAQLIKADFRGADLRGASFAAADLRGAKFMPAGAADRRFNAPANRLQVAYAYGNPKTFPPTRLEKADFTNARLQGASLILVRASQAIMIHADLRGIELSYADLSGAFLHRARLAGADLWHANLQGANLVRADLRATDLTFADLEGAVLERAFLTAADLSNARLAGAWFSESDLRAVQFQDAQATGASFRGALLRASRGLFLRGISLRQAQLDALCPNPRMPPELVDLRGVQFPPASDDGKVYLDAALNDVPDGPRRDAALRRVRTQLIQASCNALMPPARLQHRGLFYYDERRPDLLKDWPPVAEQAILAGAGWTEADFYRELATLWTEEACRDESFARVMSRLAARGPGGPSLAEEDLLAALKRQLDERIAQAKQDEAAVSAGTSGVGRPCPALLEVSQQN